MTKGKEMTENYVRVLQILADKLNYVHSFIYVSAHIIFPIWNFTPGVEISLFRSFRIFNLSFIA